MTIIIKYEKKTKFFRKSGGRGILNKNYERPDSEETAIH